MYLRTVYLVSGYLLVAVGVSTKFFRQRFTSEVVVEYCCAGLIAEESLCPTGPTFFRCSPHRFIARLAFVLCPCQLCLELAF